MGHINTLETINKQINKQHRETTQTNNTTVLFHSVHICFCHHGHRDMSSPAISWCCSRGIWTRGSPVSLCCRSEGSRVKGQTQKPEKKTSRKHTTFTTIAAAVTEATANTDIQSVWKDTSMTATMLLQDSMLKPSVVRPPSDTRDQWCSVSSVAFWFNRRQTEITLLRVGGNQKHHTHVWKRFCWGCPSAL